jgi:hypothetical protein
MSRIRTYVGPYVECRATQAKKSGVQRACTNSSCAAPKPAHKDANFCIRCGSPVGEVPVTWTTNNVHPHQHLCHSFFGHETCLRGKRRHPHREHHR